jgi:hypothetical protein
VALGIALKCVDPGARTRHSSRLPVAIASPRPGGSAWNIKLLAHDNKIARALSPKSRLPAAASRIFDMHRQGSPASRAATRAMAAASYPKHRWSSMSSNSGSKFSELRITQAYIKLLGIPENAQVPKVISLERVGACEIRMFEAAPVDDAPLFWMELFDHDAQSSVDSCSCYEIAEAAATFDDFISQAQRRTENSAPHDGETPD